MSKSGLAFDNIADPKDINELSVVLYADSFFYGLWDKTGTLSKAGYHPYISIKGLSKLWKYHYNLEHIKFISATKPFVHLDKADYEEEFFDVYFYGLHNQDNIRDYRKITDDFSFQDLTTLHYLDPRFRGNLKKSLYKKPKHISTAMAEANHQYHQGLLCYVGEGKVHITLLTEEGFRMYNQYDCSEGTDCLYFLLLICQSFDLDPTSQPVFIGGENLGKDQLVKFLSSYFPQVELINEEIKVSEPLLAPPSHYYDLHLSLIHI